MKKFFALFGVVVLGLLYVATLVAALIDSTATMDFFRASIAATIIIPVLLYIYMTVYKMQQKKREEESEDIK